MSGLGTFVQDARKRIRMPNGRTMTQADLAAKTGVSGATISHIESGKMRRPERETLEALATALGVTYNDLAFAAGYADPPTERDVEAEIRRIAALPTIEGRLEALSQLSPALYDLVLACSEALLQRAAQRRQQGDTQQEQSSNIQGNGEKRSGGALGC